MRLEKVLETHVLLNGILEYFIEHSITFFMRVNSVMPQIPYYYKKICEISHFKLLNALIRLLLNM